MRRITIAVFSLVAAASVFGQQPESTKPGLIAMPRAATSGDPYRSYQFRIRLAGPYVAAFSEMQLGSASSGAGGSLHASGGPAGVPVEVPKSLVGGASGTVTLLCSATPGTKGAPGTVTLVCSPPVNNSKPSISSGYETITLIRGISQDSDFSAWFSSARSRKTRDLSIDEFDEAGQKTGEIRLTGCKVAKSQALPSLDGSSNTVVIQLDLHCDGAVTH